MCKPQGFFLDLQSPYEIPSSLGKETQFIHFCHLHIHHLSDRSQMAVGKTVGGGNGYPFLKLTHTIQVEYIYLHLVGFYVKCR